MNIKTLAKSLTKKLPAFLASTRKFSFCVWKYPNKFHWTKFHCIEMHFKLIITVTNRKAEWNLRLNSENNNWKQWQNFSKIANFLRGLFLVNWMSCDDRVIFVYTCQILNKTWQCCITSRRGTTWFLNLPSIFFTSFTKCWCSSEVYRNGTLPFCFNLQFRSLVWLENVPGHNVASTHEIDNMQHLWVVAKSPNV